MQDQIILGRKMGTALKFTICEPRYAARERKRERKGRERHEENRSATLRRERERKRSEKKAAR